MKRLNLQTLAKKGNPDLTKPQQHLRMLRTWLLGSLKGREVQLTSSFILQPQIQNESQATGAYEEKRFKALCGQEETFSQNNLQEEEGLFPGASLKQTKTQNEMRYISFLCLVDSIVNNLSSPSILLVLDIFKYGIVRK